MTPLHSRPIELDELARLVPPDGLIVAATDGGQDPRYASVRHVAIELARETDSCLLLLERAAWSSPTEWDPAATMTAGETPSDRFSPVDLRIERGRREQLRDELADAERNGVPSVFWTSRGSGSHGLADLVARSNASLVLFPADRSRRSLVGRVIRRTLEYYARGIDAPVVAVDETGGTSLVEPLGTSTGRGGPPLRHVDRLARAGFAR